MTRTSFIITLRRILVVRCCACALIVLAASPFTAPFSTSDTAEVLSLTPVHAVDAKVKDLDDVIAPVTLDADVFALAAASVAIKLDEWRLTQPPASHSPVLRI